MPDILLLTALLAACYAGFALLALSQDRNWESVTGARHLPPGRALPLRLLGYSLLAVGLAPALLRDGAGFGSLLWGVSLSLGAIAIVATLTWRRRWLRPLARIIAPAA